MIFFTSLKTFFGRRSLIFPRVNTFCPKISSTFNTSLILSIPFIFYNFSCSLYNRNLPLNSYYIKIGAPKKAGTPLFLHNKNYFQAIAFTQIRYIISFKIASTFFKILKNVVIITRLVPPTVLLLLLYYQNLRMIPL